MQGTPQKQSEKLLSRAAAFYARRRRAPASAFELRRLRQDAEKLRRANEGDVPSEMARALTYVLENDEHALDIFQRCDAIAPDDPTVNFNWSKALLAFGYIQAAYDKAYIAWQNENARDTAINLTFASFLRGRFSEAKEMNERAAKFFDQEAEDDYNDEYSEIYSFLATNPRIDSDKFLELIEGAGTVLRDRGHPFEFALPKLEHDDEHFWVSLVVGVRCELGELIDIEREFHKFAAEKRIYAFIDGAFILSFDLFDEIVEAA